MKNYEDVKKFINSSNGILVTDDFKKVNIDKYYIDKLIKDNIIERYKRGVYLRCDTFEDEYYILQKKNPTVIYSFNTAIYLHQLAERSPINIDVTVYTGYNVNHLPKNVKVHFVKRENHKLGTTIIKTYQGFEVVVYDLERITCDLINSKNTGLDKEQTNKFLRKVFLENKIDTVKLIEYAKILNCEKRVRGIMEVLL